jgi:hypothetical protein
LLTAPSCHPTLIRLQILQRESQRNPQSLSGQSIVPGESMAEMGQLLASFHGSAGSK